MEKRSRVISRPDLRKGYSLGAGGARGGVSKLGGGGEKGRGNKL